MKKHDRLEEDWLKQSPFWMVRDFQGTSVSRSKAGKRKLRLAACGCCRLVWSHLEDSRLRQAVEVAELFADGNATATELEAAGTDADGTITKNSRGYTEDDPDAQLHTLVAMVVSATQPKAFSAALGMTMFPFPLAGCHGTREEANALIRNLLRDVFGNVFRKIEFDKRWRTDTVLSLARTMYESRDFSAMPILADALQDAGCDNDDILSHCRDAKQSHLRGCWVVDLVLGKE